MDAVTYLTNLASSVGLPLGTRYNINWRSSVTALGIDCSGFVSRLAIAAGASNISKWDWTGSLIGKVQSISRSSLTPGDVIFFGNPQREESHVAIYAGGDTIVQSSDPKGVNVGSLSAMINFYGGVVQYTRIPALTNAVMAAITGTPGPTPTPTPGPAPGPTPTPTPTPAPVGGGSGGGSSGGGGGGSSGGGGGNIASAIPASVLNGFFNQFAGPAVLGAGILFVILGLFLWKGSDVIKVVNEGASKVPPSVAEAAAVA